MSGSSAYIGTLVLPRCCRLDSEENQKVYFKEIHLCKIGTMGMESRNMSFSSGEAIPSDLGTW